MSGPFMKPERHPQYLIRTEGHFNAVVSGECSSKLKVQLRRLHYLRILNGAQEIQMFNFIFKIKFQLVI